MGRYVTGDWEYKFYFGKQNSSLGEVMEELFASVDDISLNRYIGSNDQGEIIEFELNSKKQILVAKKIILKYIKGATDVLDQENLDKQMMKEFLETFDFDKTLKTARIYVEY